MFRLELCSTAWNFRCLRLPPVSFFLASCRRASAACPAPYVAAPLVVGQRFALAMHGALAPCLCFFCYAVSVVVGVPVSFLFPVCETDSLSRRSRARFPFLYNAFVFCSFSFHSCVVPLPSADPSAGDNGRGWLRPRFLSNRGARCYY